MFDRRAIPWWAKIGIKLVFSRLPVDYGKWRRLRIFRHGAMDEPDYAYGVFEKHYRKTFGSDVSKDLVCLELGPGDSLFGALIARARGARITYLVDSGDYACKETVPYQRMYDYLRDRGYAVRPVDESKSVTALVRDYGGVYLTGGLEALRTIPTGSVDFVWSQAVLEHIRLSQFEQTMVEIRSALKPGGVCSHRVDLRDHLENALNNLRFPEKIWESQWMAKSGFYTNRIRFSEMLKIFEKAGYAVTVDGVDRWRSLPTPKTKLDSKYRGLDEQELCVSGFDVTLRPI